MIKDFILVKLETKDKENMIIVYTILNSKSLILNNATKLKKSDLLLKWKF